MAEGHTDGQVKSAIENGVKKNGSEMEGYKDSARPLHRAGRARLC